MNKKRIAVVSGGFDPLHSGHIAYLKDAKNYGEKLIVLLNSDDWLINKKGKNFLTFDERKIILENLETVDLVLGFKDDKKNSCINGLRDIKKMFPSDEIVFL
ncbi:adenylyltransferase/cytidyltransferase family protein [Gammaproteobacteria bacterium]|nr:adenylyltransferase/cytidyltransferase family protein [Gammaproteobacteria bacterium]